MQEIYASCLVILKRNWHLKHHKDRLTCQQYSEQLLKNADLKWESPHINEYNFYLHHWFYQDLPSMANFQQGLFHHYEVQQWRRYSKDAQQSHNLKNIHLVITRQSRPKLVLGLRPDFRSFGSLLKLFMASYGP